LTGEDFDLFLNWLDSDRERAAKKYTAIHQRLIVFFDARRCANSEDLADETINRIIRRSPTLEPAANEDSTALFYKVAHYVHLNYLETIVKRDGGTPSESLPDQPLSLEAELEEKELMQKCLEHCLQKLASAKREMVVHYYREDKQARIDQRKSLAERFGYSPNALRLQLFRIREELSACVTACLKAGDGKKR